MKMFKFLNLVAYWTPAIPDIVALMFTDPKEEVKDGVFSSGYLNYSLAVDDPETPSFLRKAFGIKLNPLLVTTCYFSKS
jgi:hypothetical protein